MQCDRAESYEWSPTRQQVDAYMLLLEEQILREDLKLMKLPAEEQGAVRKVAWLWSSLLWGLLTAVLGCFAWLVQIIFRA